MNEHPPYGAHPFQLLNSSYIILNTSTQIVIQKDNNNLKRIYGYYNETEFIETVGVNFEDEIQIKGRNYNTQKYLQKVFRSICIS